MTSSRPRHAVFSILTSVRRERTVHSPTTRTSSEISPIYTRPNYVKPSSKVNVQKVRTVISLTERRSSDQLLTSSRPQSAISGPKASVMLARLADSLMVMRIYVLHLLTIHSKRRGSPSPNTTRNLSISSNKIRTIIQANTPILPICMAIPCILCQ